MSRNLRFVHLVPVSALWLVACASGDADDGASPANERDLALATLQQRAGAPIGIETSELGVTRVLSMTPGFPVPGHATDPAEAATGFLASHHDALQIDASEAANFVV